MSDFKNDPICSIFTLKFTLLHNFESMTRKILLVFTFLSITVLGEAQETIRHFDPSSLTYTYPLTYEKMVARFELNGSMKVTQIGIWLDGNAGSTCKVGMYDHEGGTAFPQFEYPLFTPIFITKPNSGVEYIVVDLERPITLRNNQCFVYLREMNGVKLMSDIRIREATCTSSSGGDYYFQFNKSSSGQWSVGVRYAYGIELIVNILERNKHLFEDVTHAVGIDSNLSNASMAWADWNQDGLQDLLVAGRLFTQVDGDSIWFKNETAELNSAGNARANAFIDLDSDGDLDIYIVDNAGDSYGYEQTESGWVEHALGIPNAQRISSFSFADIDGNGFPDLFISQLWGAYPQPMPNYLYINNGDFSFADRTTAIYPKHQGTFNFSDAVLCDPNNQNTWLSGNNRNRRSRGSEWVDFDLDGDLDLYVTNYFLEEDEFYRNDGGLQFTPIISSLQIDKNNTGSNHGTGIDWADYDNDGDPDLLLPQFAHPGFSKQYDHRATTIYNNMNGSFEDTYPNNGIEFEETYAGGTWGDVNNDGLLDFYITVFYGCRYVKLYLQQPDHTFKLSTHEYGIAWINSGQDAIWVDFDRDGRLDLCSGKNGRIRLWKNTDPEVGKSLSFKLESPTGKSLAGTKFYLKTAEMEQFKTLTLGRGLRMQDPYVLHFGAGNSGIIEQIKVHWPDGTEEISGPFRSRDAGISGENPPLIWERGNAPQDPLFSQSDQNPIVILNNPGASHELRFYITTTGSSDVFVCDAVGKILEQATLSVGSSGGTVGYTLKRSLSAGTYFIYVTGQENKASRFVIQED